MALAWFQSQGLEPSDWKWVRGRILGVGGFASVYLATREEDNLRFAVKSVPSKVRDVYEIKAFQALGNEIKILAKLKSKYIVRYLGHGFSTNSSALGNREMLDMYLEYLPRGNINSFADWHKYNKPEVMTEGWIAAYTSDILRALQYLHYNNIVHGDVKGLNVLFGSDCVKLADFGSAKDCSMSIISLVLEGTTCYTAPEVARQVESTYASDMFSLGCTVIEMATGQPPNESKGDRHHAKSIPKQLSEKAQDFLRCCLKTNPKNRSTALQLLHHAFIQNRFQSPILGPRPNNSNKEFPYDCQYLDQRPEDRCFRVHYVDKFPYSGQTDQERTWSNPSSRSPMVPQGDGLFGFEDFNSGDVRVTLEENKQEQSCSSTDVDSQGRGASANDKHISRKEKTGILKLFKCLGATDELYSNAREKIKLVISQDVQYGKRVGQKIGLRFDCCRTSATNIVEPSPQKGS